jgi:hypothetical protein
MLGRRNSGARRDALNLSFPGEVGQPRAGHAAMCPRSAAVIAGTHSAICPRASTSSVSAVVASIQPAGAQAKASASAACAPASSPRQHRQFQRRRVVPVISMPAAQLAVHGVTRNPAEAVEWYRRAAEQGLANAQGNLGVALREGRGVTRNDPEYTATIRMRWRGWISG